VPCVSVPLLTRAEPIACHAGDKIEAVKNGRMQRALRGGAFLALRLTLIPLVIRAVLQRRTVTILAYHAPTPDVLEAHVRVLRRLYNFVSLSDYLDARRRGDLRALPRRALIITMDDGHSGNYALKDVIAKYKLPLTIFVCSGLVDTCRRFWFLHDETRPIVQQLKRVGDADRLAVLAMTGFGELAEFGERQALSAAELHELKTIADVQSHTVLHPILPRCSRERAESEITRSREDLERLLDRDIYAFAYPNGEYTDRELHLVEQAGYKCAVSLDPGFNSARTPVFCLRRICIPDDAGRHELIVKTSGFWQVLQAAKAALWRPHKPAAYTSATGLFGQLGRGKAARLC